VLLIACLLFVAAVFGVVSFWLLHTSRISTRNWIGGTVVIVWLAGAGTKVLLDREASSDGVDEMLSLIEPDSWSPTSTPRSAGPGGVDNVAPVASLIGGLEARLAARPADPKGWALLAQSYSFVGNGEGAERAIRRAVELGFSESELRERVELARRSARPVAGANEDLGG
jgi:hypothetical protein